ncbi:MAG: hypothetical protein HY356_08700 [Gammaproteobacteria bacterium]|nr:hypothetical protein [Gammaproteobacteria bacterium]
MKRLPHPADIITGYLDGFDPDLVVPVGQCAKHSYQIGNRDLVQETELLGDINKTATPRYGVGLIELLRDFLEKELKYKRNDDLHIAIPNITRAYRTFLASVFGVLPADAQHIIDNDFSNTSAIIHVKPTVANFVELWRPERFFPRRLSMWSLEERPLRDAVLFVCDATSPQDIIDYWNLRAAGYYVVPVPIQVSASENIKKLATNFIENNYQPYRHNPNMFHHTTVQRSRSVTEDKVKKFCESLNIKKAEEKNQFKYAMRWWYPRLWDAWARENASEGITFPYSHEEERRISEGEVRLELRSLNPKINLFREYSGEPRFANEFSFRFYGSKEPMAEVIPEGSRELSSAIGRTGYHNWRFSRFGPVFLAHNEDDLIFIDLPRAETVMTEWFRERGWKVSLSGPGRIATQLIKQLGGSFGTSWLAHRGVIDLLGELEKEAGMPRQAVIGKLKKVIADDELFFDSERFLEGLLESNALRLGARIQCPVCTRHNWYELNALGYKLVCRFCLSEFEPPVKSPKNIEWTYRAHGPFASSIAQGSFTVLLTLKFLGGDHDRGITPLFSYKAERDGKVLEADLTCLYKRSTWRETGTHVVHAECKSFNLFEQRDVDRLKDLAVAFPGAVLVFATLNESLDKTEIKIIGSLARAERRKRLRGMPYSPIVVLTGIELFSSRGLRECWNGRGGLYDQFHERSFDYSKLPSLADATQQLYLGMPSWHEWSEAERKKRKQKKVSG